VVAGEAVRAMGFKVYRASSISGAQQGIAAWKVQRDRSKRPAEHATPRRMLARRLDPPLALHKSPSELRRFKGPREILRSKDRSIPD
jgi:hypothetical protein